jgi:hypothetical protein
MEKIPLGYPYQYAISLRRSTQNFSPVFLPQCRPRLCVQTQENTTKESSNRAAMASMAHGVAAAGARHKLNAAGEDFLEPLLANTKAFDSDDDSGEFRFFYLKCFLKY